MQKATKQIVATKPLDLIIELTDARSIEATRNNEITNLFNKPKIIIATKTDLATYENIRNDVLYINIKDKNSKNKIIKMLNDFFKTKIDNLLKKGMLKPMFYVMIVGLPNVGKTSLINLLAPKKKLLVQNKPGVTRSKQLIKISDNFLLYDTPGIMMKKIESFETGCILCLLNIIKTDIIPLQEVCEWTYEFYVKKYKNELEKFFGFKIISTMNPNDFFEEVGQKYLFLTKENKVDKKRTMLYFLNLVKEGKICKVNYE